MKKEELTEQALQKILDWAESVEQLVASEAPKVVEEILMYGAVKAWFYIGISGALFLVASFGVALIIYGIKHPDYDGILDPLFCLPIVMVGLAAGVIATLVFFKSVMTLICIHYAPRLYVLEQLRGML